MTPLLFMARTYKYYVPQLGFLHQPSSHSQIVTPTNNLSSFLSMDSSDAQDFPACDWLGYGLDMTTLDPTHVKSVISDHPLLLLQYLILLHF